MKNFSLVSAFLVFVALSPVTSLAQTDTTFTITRSGSVGIGTTSPVGFLMIEGREDRDQFINLRSHDTDQEGRTAIIRMSRSRGSGAESPAPVMAGDHLGRIVGQAYDGDGYQFIAEMIFRVDPVGNVSDPSVMPGLIDFVLRPRDGSGARRTVMTIDGAGFVDIAGSDLELGTNDGRDRGTSVAQRALVHGFSDDLRINFNNDFEGGTFVDSDLEVDGDLHATGMLSKGGGSFKIDHPLDPANKYLYHSFVESPDMMNVYNGNIHLDEQGEAWVELPDWFESLNESFRYQLTPIGVPGPGLYIAEQVQNNQFKIAGGTEGMEVSWQVTGIRKDPFAVKNRIEVEVEKQDHEKGTYLYPELYQAEEVEDDE